MHPNATSRRAHLLVLSATACAVILAACAEPSPNEIQKPRTAPAVRSSTSAAADYLITDLGGFSARGANAAAVNANGHVAGTAAMADGSRHAFLWAGGHITDLGTLGGRSSRGRALNDQDDVVGQSAAADGEQHAFLWSAPGGMQDLGTVPGASAFAAGINNRGDIVGGTLTPDGTGEALWWPAGGALQDLGSFGAPGQTQFSAIDESGRAALGVNYGACNYTRGYVWRARGELTPLPSLDSPATDPCGGITVAAINDRGAVAGITASPTTTSDTYLSHPYIWHPGSSTLELLGPAGEPGQARGINNRDEVVGMVNPTGAMQPFVWTEATGLVLLPTDPAWNGDATAIGINNAGVIVGWAQIDGVQHAIMWTPVSRP